MAFGIDSKMLDDFEDSRIIIVSKSRFGGAGRAAFRWSNALSSNSVKNIFYDESTDAERVGCIHKWIYTLVKLMNRICLVLTRVSGHTPFGPVSFAIIPTFHENTLSRFASAKGSILNLHWVNSGFLSRKWLLYAQRNFSIIWTMHDTWLLNEIIHYEIPSLDIRLTKWFPYRFLASLDARYKVKILAEASGFISPTLWIAEMLSAKGVHPSRIRVVPNVVPFDVFYPITDRKSCKDFFELSPNKTTVGFVSGSDLLDRRKGLDIIIDAYRLLSEEERKTLQFVIVGRNRDLSKLPADFTCKYVSEINNDAEMNRFYNALDLLAVPSRADNFPQTATEAQSAGCPVLISNVGGCPETILNNVSGQLFEPNPTAFVSVLRSTLLEKDWLQRARSQSFEFARRAWNIEKLTKQYEAAILELAGKSQ